MNPSTIEALAIRVGASLTRYFSVSVVALLASELLGLFLSDLGIVFRRLPTY